MIIDLRTNAIAVTNISRSFYLEDGGKNQQHRSGIKLRHSHPMYYATTPSAAGIQTGAVLSQNIGGFPPFPFLFPSLPLEVSPLNTARGSGGALQAPPAGLERPRNRILSILALKSDIWWHQICPIFLRIN